MNAKQKLGLGRRNWLVLAASGALSACVVVPGGYRGGGRGRADPYGDYGDDAPVVEMAPPPPQRDVIPVPPGPGWFWISGFWTWRLGRHVWISGRWSEPRSGYVWVPQRWERQGRGWREVPGRWGRR
jgi:hypothetical protein